MCKCVCVCELALILSLCMENLLRAHVEQINDAAAGKRDGTTCRAAAVVAPVVAPVVVPATLLSISTHTQAHTHPQKNNNNSCCCQILALAFGAFNQKCRKAAKGKFSNAYKIDMMHGQFSPEFVPISRSLCPHSICCLCGQRLFTKLANVVENLYRVYIKHAIYERHQRRAHIIIDRMREPDSI